ncbi:MAG TPA: 30S ribosomal protein S21 [Chloroflexi bacterium]|jgi:small subunit ribosomal protein S21|nr:30S ribosomal protein S21 [Chloroflexota bacterium]
MSFVIREGGESFESLYRRFKKAVQQDKLRAEMKKRRYFEKPSQTRKRKAAKKRIKSRRTTLKMQRRWD